VYFCASFFVCARKQHKNTPHSPCGRIAGTLIRNPIFFAYSTAAEHAAYNVEVRTFEPEIHRVDPEFGSTLRLLQGFPVKLLGQLANFGSTL
jgi:hypothetical protein